MKFYSSSRDHTLSTTTAYRTISESILNENPGLKAGAIGPMVVSSDDIVFQFRNRSGIVRMRRSPGLIYISKEHMLEDEATLTCMLVLYRRQTPHFGTGEERLGDQLTTVFPRQRHHALDSKIVAAYRAAFITIQRIRDRVGHDLPALSESEKDCRGG